MQKERNFESLILNKIYDTNYFEEEDDDENENFPTRKKYISLLEKYKNFLKTFHNQELTSKSIADLIEISQNLVDPDNKNCFAVFSQLNDMVGQELYFKDPFQTEINNNDNNENNDQFGFLGKTIKFY